MAAVCPLCREVVHVYAGYFVRHGVRDHGHFQLCAGSGSPHCVSADSCCGG